MQKPARVPPQSLEAEQATLGAMLLARTAVETAGEILRPEDFYRDAHKAIFRAALDMVAQDQPVEFTTLAAELENRGQLEKAGGRQYLYTLVEQIPTPAHVEHYAQIVAQKAVLRRLIGAATSIVEECFGEIEDAGEVLARAEAAIDAVGQQREQRHVAGLAQMVDTALARYERLRERPTTTTGVPSGLVGLDGVTQGWQPGDFHVIGGRPGMGKTSLCMTCALNAALLGRKALMFSLEMNAEQLQNRVFQALAGVESWRLRTGALEDRHWADLSEAANTLHLGLGRGGELWIDYSRGVTPRYVQSAARRTRRENGLDLVVVDYIQRMGADGRHENETHKVSAIADGLLEVADGLELPVVAITQLSRDVERRDNKRPTMADVRQSGRIEENAAFVGLLYRASYYANKDRVPAEDPAQLIIGKSRHGGPGTVTLTFLPGQARFVDGRTDGDDE